MVWIKNPPTERKDLEDFLINCDLMELVWILIPCVFLLWMQVRSFIKMKEENEMLKVVQENPDATDTKKTGNYLPNGLNLTARLGSDNDGAVSYMHGGGFSDYNHSALKSKRRLTNNMD